MYEKSIAVIVPCFNEGQTIYRNIQKIHAFLTTRFSQFEIVVVNDGSVDNTASELNKIKPEIPLTIINCPINKGKGAAVGVGFMSSQSDIVMFLDADLAIPIEELDKFILELEKDNDLIIASRFVPGLRVATPISWHRKIMEKVFRLLRMIILNNWKVQDTQCGFKVFEGKAGRKIFSMSTINRFAFDSEIIFIAKKLGYRIKELPITLQNPKTSSVRLIYDPINMFLALIKIRINDLRGVYKWKQPELEEKI